MEIDDIDDGAEDCQQKSDFIGYDKIEESSGKWILSDSGPHIFKGNNPKFFATFFLCRTAAA